MDFEKNRELQSLDQQFSQMVMPSAVAPATAAPTSSLHLEGSRLSELRFRQYTEINRQIAKMQDLGEILERVMDAAIELTGAERGFLLLKNDQVKKKPIAGYEVKTARRLNHRSLQQEDFQFSMSAVRQVVETGSFLLTANAQADERLQSKMSVMQFQLLSILVVPLEMDGVVTGAIYLDHRFNPGCFAEEEVVFLNAFAGQAALAIQKAQLFAQIQAAKRQLETRVETQAQEIEDLNDQLDHVRERLRYGYEEIVGKSPEMMQVFGLLDHVTDTLIPVWIHGESGTGKELVARSLHVNSSRKAGPFVSENCSAIPENLLESELFGHKKGVFTHADKDRVGLFEQASGGTLFLDEVADMSPGMQVKLLRVLQEGEVRPLGSNKKVKVDVRLVTASNKDLAKLSAEGTFRQDLFFRINGLTIRLPPLRERPADIPLLVNHFIKKISKDFKLKPSEISTRAYAMLMQHPWPGNIRELESVIRNALLFAKGRVITPEFLSLTRAIPEAHAPVSPEAGAVHAMENMEERRLIMDALRKTRMNKRLAAQEIGISLRSLYMRMERHGIPKNKPVLAKFLGLKS